MANKTKLSKTLLIADDNDIFRRTLLRFLEEQYKYRIYQASNGKETLHLANNILPDVILLDINMPDMNGLEIASLLKKQVPTVPVVILTNYDEIEYRDEAKKSFADAFVIKKNLISELPEIIDTLLLN